MGRARGQFSWEGAEAHGRMEHAVSLVVNRGAPRECVAREFGVSRDVLAKWVERLAQDVRRPRRAR